jgi:hypothetical protein
VPDQATAPDETAAAAGSDAVADAAPVSAEPPQTETEPPQTETEEVLASSEAAAAETGDVVLDAAGPADEPDKSDEPSEPDKSDEASEPDEPSEPDEVDYPDEAAQHDEPDEYADDEAAADDEEYSEYEPAEAAPPRRARRWPRVLLALGFVVLAAVIVGGAIAIVGSVTHGFKKPVNITYKQSALFALKTGECFDPQGQSYSLVSCDSPHQAEVFATFSLSGTKYPGATAIAAQASNGCTSRLTGYVNPQLALSLTSTYVYPDSVAWQAGTRSVICEVRAANGTLTGSVRSAGAS